MKLIKPSFQILDQQPGLTGVLSHIELCGRTAYKSEDKITSDSAPKFVEMLIKRGHGAVLEHGTIYLVYYWDGKVCSCGEHLYKNDTMDFYYNNKYSEVIRSGNSLYITTNYRVLVENGRLEDLKYHCEPTEFHVKRITVKFVCDRGVSHKQFVA